MTILATPTNRYEAAVQREFHAMATTCGALKAELRIARITLNGIAPYVEGEWAQAELRDLVGRIDLALAEKAT